MPTTLTTHCPLPTTHYTLLTLKQHYPPRCTINSTTAVCLTHISLSCVEAAEHLDVVCVFTKGGKELAISVGNRPVARCGVHTHALDSTRCVCACAVQGGVVVWCSVVTCSMQCEVVYCHVARTHVCVCRVVWCTAVCTCVCALSCIAHYPIPTTPHRSFTRNRSANQPSTHAHTTVYMGVQSSGVIQSCSISTTHNQKRTRVGMSRVSMCVYECL
jgi:hypothetical protein